MTFNSFHASLASIVVGTVATTALAQAPDHREHRSPSSAPDDMKWFFTEEASISTFKGSGETLIGFNQTLALDLSQDISIDFSIPVYSQGDTTSVGDIDLGGAWKILNGDNSTLGKWDLAVGGGVFVPVGAESFRSSAVNPYLSAEFGCKVGIFDFVQSADYRFNSGESYITWIGAKTDSDVLNFGSALSTVWGKVDIGVLLEQVYYVNDNAAQVFVGPTVSWKAGRNVDLTASLLLPLYQDVATPEANAVFVAGLGLKF